MAKKGKGASRRPSAPSPRSANAPRTTQAARPAARTSGTGGSAAGAATKAAAPVATASRATTATKSSETAGAKSTAGTNGSAARTPARAAAPAGSSAKGIAAVASAGSGAKRISTETNGTGPAVRRAASNTREYRSRMSRYARRRRLQSQLVGGAIALVAVGALAFFLVPKLTAHSTTPTATKSACTTNAQTGLSGTPAAAGGPAAVNGTLVTLPGCLQYIDTKVGTGAAVKSGDTVTVSYTGWLTDGAKFDSSADHPGQPFSFTVGSGQVIPGWDQGVVGMKVGGTRRLIIPPSLGYGSQGQGPIPANATLIFDVTIEKIG